MNTDDFKQLMLFSVMDSPRPDWAHYLVMNASGIMLWFNHCPHPLANGMWETEEPRSERHPVRFSTLNDNDIRVRSMRVRDFPEVDWRDCRIKLNPTENEFGEHK